MTSTGGEQRRGGPALIARKNHPAPSTHEGTTILRLALSSGTTRSLSRAVDIGVEAHPTPAGALVGAGPGRGGRAGREPVFLARTRAHAE